MRIRNWIIKKLGGLTKQEVSDILDECELFACNYLKNRSGLTCYGHGLMQRGDLRRPLVVVGSYADFSETRMQSMHVAPWVRHTYQNNLMITTPTKNYKRKTSFLEGGPDDALGLSGDYFIARYAKGVK